MRWTFDKIWPVLLLVSACLYAETGSITLEMIKDYYRAFDYDKVIELSNQALSGDFAYSDQERVTIYQMKAIAHYSQREPDSALSSFVQLLEINPEFQMDPIQTSPKIVDFFQQIKNSYHTPVKRVERDTVYLKPDTVQTCAIRFDQAQVASMFVPGSGHLLNGRTFKGVFYTTLSTAALGLSISSCLDCTSKEKAYLNTTEPGLVQKRYKKYNKAYQKRSIFLALYAGTWLVSQMDLYLFQTKHTRLTTTTLNGQMALSCEIRF